MSSTLIMSENIANINSGIVDVHTHVYEESLMTQIESVVERAQKNGVQKVLIVNENFETLPKVISLTRMNQFKHYFRPCLGIHPCCIQSEKQVNDMISIIRNEYANEIVAIGEVGLDFSPFILKSQVSRIISIHSINPMDHSTSKLSAPVQQDEKIIASETIDITSSTTTSRSTSTSTTTSTTSNAINATSSNNATSTSNATNDNSANDNSANNISNHDDNGKEIDNQISQLYPKNVEELKQLQRESFIKFIHIANELKLPLNVHSRSAGRPLLDIVLSPETCPKYGILLHCFDGSMREVKRVIGREGFYFSVPATVVRSPHMEQLVKTVPLEQLLIETDSPALHPEKSTETVKYINEPSNALVSLKKIAEIKGVSVGQVIQQTSINAHKLFPRL